jgi:hypothetical protein
MGISTEDPEGVVVDALMGVGGPLAPPTAAPEVPAVASTITAAAAAAGHTNHFLMNA